MKSLDDRKSPADETLEHQLDGFARGISSMRSRLLANGNLLGLAYTAYCSNDLRFV